MYVYIYIYIYVYIYTCIIVLARLPPSSPAVSSRRDSNISS